MDPAPGVVRVLGRRQRVQERSQGGPARKRSRKRQKRGHGRLEAHSGVQTTTNESQGSDGGKSQGGDGKNRYLFVAREEKTMSTRDVYAGTSATQTSSSSGALSSDQSAPYFDGISSIEMAKKEALRSGVREFEMDMPGPDTEEGESFAVAAKQANAVHAKYRYIVPEALFPLLSMHTMTHHFPPFSPQVRGSSRLWSRLLSGMLVNHSAHGLFLPHSRD